MRHLAVFSLLFSLGLLATTQTAAQDFELPIRINMGGREVVDSNGNVWLGDEGVNQDPLDIRPNDIGGGQAIVNWSAAVIPDSVTALGFDGNNPEDLQIFKDIRWDNAGEVPDWYMEIPVPNTSYTVNFYLVDAGDGRHYSFEIEGEIVEEDVHQLAFPVGEGWVPGPNVAGRYSYEVFVTDGALSIGILPGFGLPGAADPNPILQGLEIIPNDPDFDPCEDAAFGVCATGIQCETPGPDLGENVALGGFATQSSEGWGGTPDRAIDGNTNGIWGAGTTTHTNGAPSWWEVDLQNSFDIGTIRLWNRMDCCSERLTNFTVTILDFEREVAWEESFLTAGERINGPNFTIDGIEVEGQFIRISMPGAFLSLAEVQVYSETVAEDWEPTTQVSWDPPFCAEPLGYEVYRNDELIMELPGDATGFEHSPDRRQTNYRVETLAADGQQCNSPMTCTAVNNSLPFEAPFRINMGGPEFTDSNGDLWLGDMGGDPLNIRPNDTGGSNEILAWSSPTQESVEALGFEAEDMDLFRSIRWDNAADGVANEWQMEIPIADGLYEIYFYLCDGGDNRHYKIALEGTIVEEDVHQLAFPTGPGIVAGPNQVGMYSFLAEVNDGALSIGMIGCFDCPGVTDSNPILQALQVLPADPNADPCQNIAFQGRCATGLICEEAGGEAAISWEAPGCFQPVGYEVWRNDELILELAGDETRFEDIIDSRNSIYRIETIAPAGVETCPPMFCTLGESVAFEVPLRINFSGPEVVDEFGNVWLGDQVGVGDELNIRPIDAQGTNTILNWCVANPKSVAALGYDPLGPMTSVLSSIRWDPDSLNTPFDIELAIPDGEYTVNLFFIECCCPQRHFSVSLEDELVYEDVHQGDYDPGPAINGGIGRYSFQNVEVLDGSLSIRLTGLAGAGDVNALISALEILPADFDPCDNPEFAGCASGIRCEMTEPDLGENHALGGIATQSSEGWGGNPMRAIDGNTNGQWGAGTTTHTDQIDGTPSWWEVDLQDVFDINTVVLWNRMDCCSERLTNFTVSIIDDGGGIAWEETFLSDGSMINGPSFTIEDIATEGRFLRISIPGAYLSLAEVQIFSGGRDEDWESVAQVSWNPPTCFDPLGYEVYRNDELILELPADAAAFEHTPDRRSTQYRIETIVPNGVDECPAMTCSASNTSIPFDVPLRINFAGPEVVDDEGNVWLGDENSPADLLGIRPNDVNGANHIANWCAPDILSLEELGFDPFGPMASALSSIRWDSDSLNSPFELELAVPEGEYTVNLFFIECCCPNRHYSISIEGELVWEDVHQGDFSPGPNVAGGIGFYSFEGVEVFDEGLTITLTGIPGGDVNALITALEVIPEDIVVRPENCTNGIDDDRDGSTDCDDTDCADVVACIPAEICDNGIDDDRDGRADCDDTDCAEAANCEVVGPRFVRGDTNSDGSINLTDGVIPLLYLFSGGAPPACLDSADTNDTGSIEITDAIIVFGWLFSGGAPPAEPSPLSPGYSRKECAVDPTDDGIGCDRVAPTCN